jgi:hypothetical protein
MQRGVSRQANLVSMWGAMSSVRRYVASGSVVVLAVVLAGLGAPSANAGQSVSSASLARYVVQTGEESGYSLSSTPTFTRSAASWATGGPDAPTDAKRLRGEGFRGALTQHTTGSNGTVGESFVIALASPAAAAAEERAQLEEDLAENGAVTRFTIKQLRTSEGFAAPGTNSAANVLFVEGSCVLLVGDETDGAANPRPPVIAGALKVYGRTAHRAGVCG